MLDWSGSPLEAINEAITIEPEIALAYSLRASLKLLSTNVNGREESVVQDILQSEKNLDRNRKDGLGDFAIVDGYHHAAKALQHGDWISAVNSLEVGSNLCVSGCADIAQQGILRTHPLETFAVKMAHDIYFYGGGIFHRGRDATVMEESLRRVKPAFIEAASPYLGYVRGMHAFALGECFRFDEAQARAAFLCFVLS